MLFNSYPFLFLFLPIVLIGYPKAPLASLDRLKAQVEAYKVEQP